LDRFLRVSLRVLGRTQTPDVDSVVEEPVPPVQVREVAQSGAR
jgi:hypothetical protein